MQLQIRHGAPARARRCDKREGIRIIDNHCYEMHMMSCSRIFSDERDKWKLLGMISGTELTSRGEICAFCVLDDELALVWRYAPGTAVDPAFLPEEILRQTGDEYIQTYRDKIGLRIPDPCPDVRMERCPMGELWKMCRNIHMLPVARGYTHRPSDYWYSSFEKYIMRYDWSFVSTQGVAEQIPMSDFIRMHRGYRRAMRREAV